MTPLSTAAAPLVSVVMATYNRSNILRLAIETVRRQTVTDWELLVVGDGCSDDTADVVASFADARIRFWNLAEPAGEQSGPNNAGLAAARGRYAAFLNHDDFWMPRHLERAIAAFGADDGLDLAYGLNVAAYPDGSFVLWGPTPVGARLPPAGVPASAWVFRRTLVDRVGPWRPARDLHLVPSQDWLRRAEEAGATLRFIPRLSVLSIPSNARPRSYADRQSDEHTRWFHRMTTEPGWAEDLLAELLSDRELSSSISGNSTAVAPFALRAIKNAGKRGLGMVGLSPLAVAMWMRHGRRGGFIRDARRTRGLDP
jgi:glycosyltransferase involved in cell wall biosynthesis